MASKKTAGKQRRGRPFARGQSGNKAGRPPGSRNKATLMSEAISEGDALAIARAVVGKAKKGDATAARLVLDRLWPVPRGHTIKSRSGIIPKVASSADVLAAHGAVIRSVATGELPTDAAQALSELFERQLRMIETTAIEDRLKALELRIASEHGSRSNEEGN
ncbi:MAG: DUF5681 domain-containing protein [Bradyrhizobium sp.]|uniref:DUF5681 domain-containing protein n=1 Tax=Bradyrhizobium sp. TaxID=376 RepID=UPI002721662F|nr:DUF5681 domain-containing protein [Bradyrhizobium sp.]MDO8399006.1 DUF5681 domain-containing protein [Bradyrhizobium sp.]